MVISPVIGEVVYVKGGSMPMRVLSIDEDGTVHCAWSNTSGVPQYGTWPHICLTREVTTRWPNRLSVVRNENNQETT